MSNYYERREVANSTLSLIDHERRGSPKLFKMYLDNKIIKQKPTFSINNGVFVHRYFEEPETFVVSKVDKPNDNLMKVYDEYILIKDLYFEKTLDELLIMASRNANYYNNRKEESLLKAINESSLKDFIVEVEESKDKLILTKEQKIVVEGCCNALLKHPMCYKYLLEVNEGDKVFNELEIFFEHWGIKMKSKLDRVLVNEETKTIILTDIKTSGKSAYLFSESFNYWKYYRQFYYYKVALSYLYPGYEVQIFIPVVDNVYFSTACYKISSSSLDMGELDMKNLVDRVKWHQENNLWDHLKEEYDNNLILNL